MAVKKYELFNGTDSYDLFYEFEKRFENSKIPYFEKIEKDLGHEEVIVGHLNKTTFRIIYSNDNLYAQIFGNLEDIQNTKSDLEKICDLEFKESI